MLKLFCLPKASRKTCYQFIDNFCQINDNIDIIIRLKAFVLNYLSVEILKCKFGVHITTFTLLVTKVNRPTETINCHKTKEQVTKIRELLQTKTASLNQCLLFSEMYERLTASYSKTSKLYFTIWISFISYSKLRCYLHKKFIHLLEKYKKNKEIPKTAKICH